jgi:hypothetical protein
MENLKIVLAGPGLGLEHVLQGIYLTRLEDDDARMNASARGTSRPTAGWRARSAARAAGRSWRVSPFE